MTHSCNHCKTEFRQRRQNQVYCGQSCRQMAYIMRHLAPKPAEPVPSDQLAGLANLLGGLDPVLVTQILNTAVNKPSMTDQLTDKRESAVNPHVTAQNSSQSVNSSFTKTEQTVDVNAANLHEKRQETTNPHEKPKEPESATSVLQKMIRQGFTISIGPNGYVRSLFPHWENRDWLLAVYVNEKMLGVFDQLKQASFAEKISCKTLVNCYEKMKEIGMGLYSHSLPADYPFMLFIRFLMYRLEALLESARGMKEIKFQVPEELEKMMNILIIQLTPDN